MRKLIERLEEASAPGIDKSAGDLLRHLWKAEDVLRNIEGVFHYAIKGTLGGTGHPIKDKKARKDIEKSYEFIKELEKDIKNLLSKVNVLKKQSNVADAQISAMFGESMIEAKGDLSKKYSEKEAMDLFVASTGVMDGEYPYLADKWGNPKNKSLKKWFDKFKEKLSRRGETRMREFPYYT